jgi:hypothetical protein
MDNLIRLIAQDARGVRIALHFIEIWPLLNNFDDRLE